MVLAVKPGRPLAGGNKSNHKTGVSRMSAATIQFRTAPLAVLAVLLSMPLAAVAQVGACNGEPATIIGTEGDDVLTGTNGRDVIAGLGGNDVINGLKGNDVICGDDGNDTINASFGEDLVFGGRGDDTLNGDKGEDQLFGGLGTDVLNGGVGTDICDGGIGQDTATACESTDNVTMAVKRVVVDNGGFVPASGPLAGQRVPGLDGALFVPKNARGIAILATHGASGRFDASVTGWLGWWMEPYDVAVLALNRRDSSAYGPSEGGGATLYEYTLCDLGAGVDYLISLGFTQVIVQGHSKGTTVAGVYPSWYRNCPGKAGGVAANDPNVAGVVNIGTVVEPRESGIYAPYGAYYYDVNNARAAQLAGAGFGNVLYPPGAPPFFGPQFFIQPPGFPAGPPPLPAIPFTSTPASYLSYNGPATLRNVERESQKLVIPHLIIHAEGDRTTLRSWSDRLFQVLTDNGNLVAYETPLYESLGYSNPGPGFNAHGLAAEGSRFDAAERIWNWSVGNVPGATDVATRLKLRTIQALPDFSPALLPPPTVP
jgi:hypothetical protein